MKPLIAVLAGLAAILLVPATATAEVEGWHHHRAETANGVKLYLTPQIGCGFGFGGATESTKETEEAEQAAKEGEDKIEPSGTVEGPFWNIRAILRWPGHSKTLKVTAGCNIETIVAIYAGPGWEAELKGGEGPLIVKLEVTSHKPTVGYHIKVEWVGGGSLPGGTLGYLESADVALHSEYTRARRIDESEDAFVNYCIDKHHEITSIDHRLGCWTEPGRYVTAKVQWAH